MPDSQFQRDLNSLGLLADAVITKVEDVLAGIPASQKSDYRGPLANAMMRIIAQNYTEDRERYAEPIPGIPPTPVPDPAI